MLAVHLQRLCMWTRARLFRLCARILIIGCICSTAYLLLPDAAVCRVATGYRLKALIVGDIRLVRLFCRTVSTNSPFARFVCTLQFLQFHSFWTPG